MVIHIFPAADTVNSHLVHPGLQRQWDELWVLWAVLCTHDNFTLWVANEESNLEIKWM